MISTIMVECLALCHKEYLLQGIEYNIYSRAMKTQHPNEHQYLQDILNMLSQRISGDFMNTKERHHIGFITFNVKCPYVYTHAYFPTVV